MWGGPLRDRIRAWWHARHPPTDTWTLTQRNVDILPTRAGALFCVTLFAMLIATINFRLNLGYVLIFLLAGAGIVSMHVTHNTLRGLALHLRPPQPGFAGQPLPVEVVLHTPGRERLGLALSFDARGTGGKAHWVHADVARGAQHTATLSVVPPARGVHELAPIVVETRFPFGLFRAWTVWRPASKVLAWPAPEQPAPPWPVAPHSVHGSGRVQTSRDGGEWEGVRGWQRGDPLNRLVWKKLARSGELVSRDTSSVESREIVFDYEHTRGRDAESRLARLAAWVLAAHEQGLPHGLRLPGTTIEPELGDAHRRQELDALALFTGRG
jgi:uncharacterized protein (DUF58 family)